MQHISQTFIHGRRTLMSQIPLRKIGITAAVFFGIWIFSKYLLPIFLPFLFALALAILAEPFIKVLHTKLRLPRALASGFGILLTLLLFILSVLTLCALLVRQLGHFSGILPDLGNAAIGGMHALEGFLLDLAQKTPESMSPILSGSVENLFSDGTALVNQAVGKAVTIASDVVTRIPDSALNLGTWILASFMISARLPQLRHWLTQKIPSVWKERYLPQLQQLKRNILGWFCAQLKLISITFLVLSLGFLLLRIPYALIWGGIISLVDALPVLGTGTILIPWSIIEFLQGNQVLGAGILGIYAIAALIRSVLEPKFVGKQLGLDPLITLLAMYTGYRLWGILGMLLSPLLAVTVTQLLVPKKSG